ncbi:hypothetical protein AX17_003771 [Amanita inopinata Kibby_2008]|nr:hypothetical protein AX17_003771 [Amanita inopinata Kibby_2008]
MREILPSSLSDLQYRVAYTRSFLDFTDADAAALHEAKPFLAPLVPSIIDRLYVKLFNYTITAQAFVPFTGKTPTALPDLTLDHPQVKSSKDLIAGYLAKLVTMDYDDPKTWEYLDKLGRMHTGVEDTGFKHRDNKPPLRVEYIHLALTLGLVQDIITTKVLKHPDLTMETKLAVTRALNKLIWLQNDLFARHYIEDEASEK